MIVAAYVLVWACVFAATFFISFILDLQRVELTNAQIFGAQNFIGLSSTFTACRKIPWKFDQSDVRIICI